MARHRSVRGMNYDDDYDGYDDDLYGHSVEDDYGVSPATAEQFLVGGSHRGQQLSSYLENIGEQDEEERMEQKPVGADYKRPQLSDTDEARLHSCLDEIRNIVGETVPEHVMTQTILDSDFRFETALDRVLNYQEQGKVRLPVQQPKVVKGATQVIKLPAQPDVISNYSLGRPSLGGVSHIQGANQESVLSHPNVGTVAANNQNFQGRVTQYDIPISFNHSEQFPSAGTHSIMQGETRNLRGHSRDFADGTKNYSSEASFPRIQGQKGCRETRDWSDCKTGNGSEQMGIIGTDISHPIPQPYEPPLDFATLAGENSELGSKSGGSSYDRTDMSRPKNGSNIASYDDESKPTMSIPSSDLGRSRPRHGSKVKLAANFDIKGVRDIVKHNNGDGDTDASTLTNATGIGENDHAPMGSGTVCRGSTGPCADPARGTVGLSLSDLASQHQEKAKLGASLPSSKIGSFHPSGRDGLPTPREVSPPAVTRRDPPQRSLLSQLADQHLEGDGLGKRESSRVMSDGTTLGHLTGNITTLSVSPSLSDLAGLHLSSQNGRSSQLVPVETKDKSPVGSFASPSRFSAKQARKKKKNAEILAETTYSSGGCEDGSDDGSKWLPVTLSHDQLILSLRPSKDSPKASYLVKPSCFAASLCLRYVHPRRQPWCTASPATQGGVCRRFEFHRQASSDGPVDNDCKTTVVPFDFATPSPDDIVKKQQGAAFQRSPMRSCNLPSEDPLQRRLRDESIAGLSKGVTQMSFARPSEAKVGFEVKEPPKVKVEESATPVPSPLSPERRGSMQKSNSSSDLNSLTSTPSRKESRTKPLNIDVLKEYTERQGGKDLLNMVVIGHVDAGKSTLMGHLLYLLGQVNKRQMHKYETESKKQGKASFAYAWVLDETGEERERGITMDVGLTRFETEHRMVTLLDAPGHKDFIPNMISGAAQADVAILVIDATRGEFETGFESGGQTREHAILARSLGVTQLAVAVNKMDTVGWAQERFVEIVDKLKTFLKKTGYKDSDVSYVPCSGLDGENLVKRAKAEDLVKWYNGPCLMEQIDKFKSPSRPMDKSFRMCVTDVFKGIGAGISICGRIESGSIVIGDRVTAMPLGEGGIVKGISVQDEDAKWACAGDQSILVVTGIDQMKVNVGSVLCSRIDPIRTATRFQARIIVFDIEVPITKGFMVLLHYQAVNEPAVVRKLVSTLHKNTGEVLQKKPKCLTKNTNALVEIETSRPICIELYKDYKDLGRFMLRYSGHTIAAGLVTEIKHV